jgi:hypothetical protein
MESILEDISPEVAKIKVPTVLLAGELDQVYSIERHKTEVLAQVRHQTSQETVNPLRISSGN